MSINVEDIYLFPSGDNAGKIIGSKSHVLRVASAGHKDHPSKIFRLYAQYALHLFGVVKTEFISEENVLKHERLFITYPHEWPPALFKDAVLFHLQLLLQLDRYGLTLKDALPENILFTGVTPTFIDFFSLLPVGDLVNEEWLLLGSAEGMDLRLQVLDRMFVPYMLLPLLTYARGDYTEGRRLLQHCFCNNCRNDIPGWASFGSGLPARLRLWLQVLRSSERAVLQGQIRAIRRLSKRECEISWEQRVQGLIRHIETLDVMPPASGYVDYYAAKGEDAGLCNPDSWNDKQHGVAKVLAAHNPRTVLDIGANTGWFSLLAAQNGAKVIALDSDLSSIDALYRTAKYAFPASITPLWMSFDDLRKENFSLDAAGNVQEHPFHMAATKRLRSDMVFCLGLLHHLTLGMGKRIEDVLETLFALTNKVLILEFVDINDPLILDNPDFFSALTHWDDSSYSQEKINAVTDRFGFTCSVLPSTPSSTRQLLVFEK